ncbi:Fructosamine-3-kinase [Mariprofundus ferrinatatus]|uniref:Fructosamine-3-kinase n=1 Tax=Mariprofundus ferrinatatus TaxID=1921087 RepID=A0A2K8L476_9PROT|nr:fructosamine kinase family protein [Mariprofundus ferrinatatus]ATX82087.1 Fructosamine-3-kinase [Mariprofundus ferrinatatus]
MFGNSNGGLWELITASLADEGRGEIVDYHAISGGSINSAYRATTESGDHLFVKTNHANGLAMFEAEFDGLNELADAEAIRVPRPIATGSGAGRAWFVSEYIRIGRGRGDSAAEMGRQMAALHRKTADRFGWFRDNTIGTTPQPNAQTSNWVNFYRDQRLGFQLELAGHNGFGGALLRNGERLLSDLDRFFSSYTPEPSLLHGDLWGGNHAFDENGAPVIFDPAVYYGDREADIAMTELFGGFGSDFYDAYNESWPLDEGYRVRKTLYNLYHILNHANLFGGGYASQASSMIDMLLSEASFERI